MKDITEIKIGRITAISSFALGTFLFLAYSFTKNDAFAITGFYYLLFIIPVNLLVLLALIIAALAKKDRLAEHLKTIGLMLLNIPIAWSYFNLLTF